jgi:hypothetical protein
MNPALRYSTVTAYLRASVERAMAMMARRLPLVAADELQRLGKLAFGDDHAGDVVQGVFDQIAGCAALVALGMERAADLDGDRALLDTGLPIETAQLLRKYADDYARVTLEREGHTRNGAVRSGEAATVREFIRALLEFEMAGQARWQSPVAADEVARLGAITFPSGDEKRRLAIEHVVRYAAAGALGLPLAPNPVRDLEVDRELTPETATAMRTYAESIAADIVKRQTKAPAPNPELPNLARSGTHRRGIATEYCGVWEPGAIYGAGTMVTDRGTLWFAQAESTSARPGASSDWKMMVKTKERA